MEVENFDVKKNNKFYTEEQSVTDDDAKIILYEEPDVLPKSQVLLMNLSWFGLSLMFLLLSVEVIPAQIRSLVGESAKGRWLGGMVAAGAALTFFTSPLIGLTSDRLTFQAGKRRPVMAIGTIALCVENMHLYYHGMTFDRLLVFYFDDIGLLTMGVAINRTASLMAKCLSFGLAGMAFSASSVVIIHGGEAATIKNSTATCQRDLVAHRCRPYWNKTSKLLHENTILKGSQPSSILMPEKKSVNEEVQKEPVGNLGLYIVFYLMVTLSFATITVPYNALIADKSHSSQRGFNSGVMGAMILLGNVSGAAVGTCFTEIGVLGSYGTAIAVVMISVCVTIFAVREKPGKQVTEAIDCITIFCGFWQPLKEHDFRWVFITRFLMQQGVSTVTGFLEYWLSDMIQLPYCWNSSRAVGLLLLPLLFAAAISSIVFGIASDSCGRRKPIVITAAIVMFLSTTTLTYIHKYSSGYYIAVAMAFFFGMGFGSFQSVDFALVMDVLPDERDKAKDIAVWHQALILPNAIATPIGGIILDYFESVDCEVGLGYIILFVLTTIYFMLSGIFVTKIRRAK